MGQLFNPAVLKVKSFKKSQYFQKMLDGDDSEYKLMQRKKVNMFLFMNADNDAPLRFLTLPGGTWAFERAFFAGSRIPFFVGLEREQLIFERSIFFLPGMKREEFPLSMLYPSGNIQVVQSEAASLLHCCLSAFVSAVPKGSNPNRYYKKFCNFSGVWLDFNSPLCPELENSLPLLDNVLNGWCHTVPVVISVLAAREPDYHLYSDVIVSKSRSEAVLGLLSKSRRRRFDLVESFVYVGPDGTRMETLFTLAHLKETECPPLPYTSIL